MVMKLSGGLDARATSSAGRTTLESSAQQPARRAGGVNLLASWHLEKPSKMPFPVRPAATDRRRRPQPRSRLYDFPNQKVVKHFLPEMPLRTSALRTLGGYSNVFAARIVRGPSSRSPRAPIRSSSGCGT